MVNCWSHCFLQTKPSFLGDKGCQGIEIWFESHIKFSVLFNLTLVCRHFCPYSPQWGLNSACSSLSSFCWEHCWCSCFTTKHLSWILELFNHFTPSEDLMNSQAFAGTITLSSCRFLLNLAETSKQTKQQRPTHSLNAIICRFESTFLNSNRNPVVSEFSCHSKLVRKEHHENPCCYFDSKTSRIACTTACMSSWVL